MFKNKYICCFFASIFASSLLFCSIKGDGTSDVKNDKSAVMVNTITGTVPGKAQVSDISSIQISISGSALTAPITQQLTQTTTGWSGTISEIPVGNDYTFSAEARDSGNNLIFSGSANNVVITTGQVSAVNIFMQETNQPSYDFTGPVIDSFTTPSTDVLSGSTVQLAVSARHPRNRPVGYNWSSTAGAFNYSDQASIQWTAPAQAGSYSISIAVSDDYGNANNMSYTLAVTESQSAGSSNIITTINTSPTVSNLTANPGQLYPDDASTTQPGVYTTTLTVTADDSEGDTISYNWTSSCSGTFTSSSETATNWTISNGAIFQNCTFTVTIQDDRGGTSTATKIVAYTSNPFGTISSDPTSDTRPALTTILSACEYLNDGEVPVDSFQPPSNALYVSNSGDDNNSGTSITDAFLHIGKAIEHANNNPATPYTIFIQGGTYFYDTYDNNTYQEINRGNLYITNYQNERVIIKPSFWAGGDETQNPSDAGDETAFDSSGSYENITFDGLEFEGWSTVFSMGLPYNTPESPAAQPMRNITFKNIKASRFTHRHGNTNYISVFFQTSYLGKDVYGAGKAIFTDPETADYQLENVILDTIEVSDVSMAINVGDENDANIKGMRITNFKSINPPSGAGDSASDAIAVVNSDKILIDHCKIVNIADDGIDTKGFNVSVVNTYVEGTGRNGVKFWRNGEIINTIIYNCTVINDGALIIEEGPFRMINSVLIRKTIGYSVSYDYGSHKVSSDLCTIVNSIFYDLDHTFYLGNVNLTSLNSLYGDMPDGIFRGSVTVDNITQLNELINCSGNIDNDPQFADAPNGNFKLSAGSPAIDAGTSSGVLLPTFDFNGNSRIKGSAPDIGPFEY